VWKLGQHEQRPRGRMFEGLHRDMCLPCSVWGEWQEVGWGTGQGQTSHWESQALSWVVEVFSQEEC
jgi:hypothetical protein